MCSYNIYTATKAALFDQKYTKNCNIVKYKWGWYSMGVSNYDLISIFG